MANAFTVADVVELWVWGSNNSMTDSQLESHIDTTIPEEAIELDLESPGDPAEELAQQVFEEILHRQELLGDAYPFACDGHRIRFRGATGGPSSYIFCLLLSHLPAQLIQLDQRTRQFETLVTAAAQGFFGGSAIRIGFPWDAPTYRELLDRVIVLLPNLIQADPEVHVVGGDRGWDVIVVKGFNDNHFPKLIALGNCATGRSDWRKKGLETAPDFFWECFLRQRAGTWVTFSAVPFLMDEDARGRKGTQSNLTFDRHRICGLAPTMESGAAVWIESQRGNASNVPLDSSI
jgi:hypothetical protein